MNLRWLRSGLWSILGSTIALCVLAPAAFAQNPVPTVSSLNPTSVPVGSGNTTVTITGTGFVDNTNTTAQVGGVDRPANVLSATSLTFTFAAAELTAATTYQVGVFNSTAPGGGGASATTLPFTVDNPVPTLTVINPSSVTFGAAQFTLTLVGTNFVATSTVEWNGVPLATTFLNSTALLATVPAANVAAAGTANVTVVNPTPGGGTSSAQTFTIGNPVPTVTSISPSTATAGGAQFTLTVDGTNFLNGVTVVRWNGAARTTTFVSATQVTAVIPASDIATAAANIPVTAFNAAPGGGSSTVVAGSLFTVNNPAPSVTGLSPTSVLAGSAQFTLTVTGTNFVSTSTVLWNGVTSLTTTFDSSTQLRAVIPAATVATAGTNLVFASNPAPGGGAASQSFDVNNPSPTITSINPQTVFTGGAAFTLTVNGTNFNSQTSVQINGVARTTSLVSGTQVTVAVLASDIATAGPRTVTAVNPAPGGGSQGTTLNVDNPSPVITSFNPASAAAGGPAFTLTINGSGFVSGASVLWNGSARTTTLVSSTVLTAAISAADIASGATVGVTVVNPAPGGGVTTASYNSTSPTPTISSLNPASTLVGGAQFTLTVNGTGFISNSQVQWDSSARTTTFVSSTVLTAVITAADIATAASHTVIVFNPAPAGGIATRNFDVENPLPAITSLSPASTIAPGAALTLTINGSNFVASSTVTFGATSKAGPSSTARSSRSRSRWARWPSPPRSP